MKRILLLFTLLIAGGAAMAQQRTSSLKGTILDAVTGEPLIGALVLVDSTRHATVDLKGTFTVTGVARGKKRVDISYLGYETITRTVDFNQASVSLGTVRLREEGRNIEAVTVTGSANMAIQKGDTTQFNAAAFKTNPDADAGELIAKLPGAEVDEGSVKVQGETVKRAYIDGKLFFGDDVMTAMNNLPADAIESVQLFDELTDEAKFSGFDDGNRQRALNIVTKHKVNRSTTGRVEAGYGLEVDKDPNGDRQQRYLIGGNVNTFTEKNRWSLNGTFNNVNRANRGQGYSGGGGGGMFGGGLRTINSLGVNYSGTWSEKLEFNASYSFNQNRNKTEGWDEKDFFQIDEASEHRFVRNESTGRSTSDTHEGNIRLEYNGGRNRIYFTANGSYKNDDSWSHKDSYGWLNEILNSEVRNKNWSDGSSYNVGGNLYWTHRLGQKAGRTLILNLSGTLNEGDSDSHRDQETPRDDPEEGNLLTQTITTSDNWSRNIGGRLSYTEPIGEHSRLMATYRLSHDENKKTVYAEDENGDQDIARSSTYSRNYLRNTVGLGYVFKNDEFRVNANLDYQSSAQERVESFPDDSKFNQTFYSWQPRAGVRYSLERSKFFELSYRGNSNLPSIEQLQNVLTESGTSLTVGNPGLKQSYAHSFNLRYNTSNVEKSTNFFAFIDASQTDNSVAYRTEFFDRDTVLVEYHDYLAIKGSQLRKPENVNGAVSLRSMMGYSFTLRPLKTNINLGGGYSYTRTPSYTALRGVEEQLLNYSNVHGGSFRIAFVSNISEKVDFDISSYTSLSYAVNTAMENRRSWTESVRGRVNVIFLGGFTYNTDFSWRYQHSQNNNRNTTTNSYIWNMGIGYKFLRRKSAEFRVSMYDVLKQSQKAPRTSFADTYQSTNWNRSLGRYVMATFSYRFNSMNKLGNGGGRDSDGGERRMMGPPPGGHGGPHGGRPGGF